MSFLRKGGRKTGVLTTVVTLAAFQVLAVITAGVAQAATCTYNPATDTINITIGVNEFAAVAVETTAADLDTESAAGAILFDNNGLGFEDGANSTACGSATNTNTVAIIVLGSPNADETFNIDENSGAPFNTAIVWNLDLGGNTVGGTDTFDVDLNDDQDNSIVVTNTSFNLNGAVGELLGAEYLQMDGGNGDDVIDLSGASLQSDSNGDDGDDVLSPGTNIGDDHQHGDAGVDTLSFATRTTCTVITGNSTAGLDGNCDGDLADAGDDEDDIFDLEIYVGGSNKDVITGDSGTDEVFVPGDGDDTVTGNVGDDDALDYSSSSAGMVIDPNTTPTGTATGQGIDAFTDVFNFAGSAFDDVLIWDSSVDGFAGGAGIDTVDATAETTGQVLNLDLLDDLTGTLLAQTVTDTLENALGGSGPDTITGNDVRNDLMGNDGDDFLFGAAGNDTLTGGLGNDAFDGGSGADKVSFATNTTSGVNVDMNLGFATSAESGDDGFGGAPLAITGPVEIIQGSPFNDSITGGGGLTTVNFLFTGGNGKDTLTGSGSNDTLKGGGGNDKLRGLEGGDNLKGGKGSNDKGWGGPGVDFCTGIEVERGCE